MKADKTFSGVQPDYGTILRVQSRVTSESTAAISEQLAIYDSAYMGGHFRPVRQVVYVDRPMFGLSMMENNIPAVTMALNTALDAFKPYDSLGELDAILDQMGGSSRAPVVTVIPCTTLLANGYKFADSLIQAQNAWYQDNASWQAAGTGHGNADPVTEISFTSRRLDPQPELPINAPYVALGTLSVRGTPTMPRDGYQPYNDGTIMLLPVRGQGPAPFLSGGRYWDEMLPSLSHSGAGPTAKPKVGVTEFHDVLPLRWAIFYQEQDAEIDSPVKKLMMIAFLNHLFEYLDGVNLRPSQYQWPDSNGAKSDPYSPTSVAHTGHDFMNLLIADVARAAAIRLQYKTAEELPSSQELQLIRALANLGYFLDNRDLIIRALMNTSSMRQFITILLESQLIRAGATVEAVRNSPTGPVIQAIDFQGGIAPEQACEFLWERVMTLLPRTVFDLAAVGASGGPLGPVIAALTHSLNNPTSDEMGKAAYLAMRRSLAQGFTSHGPAVQGVGGIARQGAAPGKNTGDLVPPRGAGKRAREGNVLEVDNTLSLALSATAFGRTQIKNLAIDMRADYLASALLARFRESIPVVIALLKGEMEGFEHLHITVPPLTAEVTLNVLESVQLMLERDLLVTEDVLQWEEPYGGAHFSTPWQAFSVRFPMYPIPYVVHDLAADYRRDIRLASARLNDKTSRPAISTIVENAFKTVGLTLVQCEPALTYVPLGGDQVTAETYTTYMAGELEAVGRDKLCTRLYGDVSPSHGALRVTSTYYVRSATVWNQMMEMPRQVVARAYNPQPTPNLWHDFVRLTCTRAQLHSVLHNASDTLIAGLWPTDVSAGAGVTFEHWIDLNPAFRDVAAVLPYVQMMVQTPPEAYAFTMMSRVEFDPTQRICTIAGTPIVLATANVDSGLSSVDQWAIPNLSTQMAYQAKPLTHMVLPLVWNAVR